MLYHIEIQIPTDTLKYQGCLEEPKLVILAQCAPPPFMANAILNFHFDYWHTSLITYESGTILGTLYRGLDSFLYCIGFRISQGRTGTPVKKENSLQNIFLGRKFLSLLVKSLLYGVQGQKYFVISKIAASTKINKKIIFVLQYLYTIDSKAEMHITFVSSELCQFFQPLHSILLSCLV